MQSMCAHARPRTHRMVRMTAFALLTALLTTANASVPEFQVQTLADGLDGPWGLAFLPDGRMLVTEKSGALLLLGPDGKRLASIRNVPPAFVKLQGGLLDVVLHPRFEENSLVYLSLSHGRQKHNTTRIVRGVLRDDALENVEVIFDTTPKGTAVHYGGRLAFLPDGTLLLTSGEGADYREHAQRLDTLLGKVVRINDDGSIPSDNPFVGRQGAEPAIWTYGHRNPQGLCVDPATGVVYLTEHGPKGGDEINVIEPGVNYGWPIATHGIDYSGARISPFETYPGMHEPLLYWTPSIGVGGIAVYRGDMFPEWDGDLLVGALGHTHLQRVDMEDGRVVGQHILLQDLQARFREVEVGPDGAIYAVLETVAGAEKSGRIIRLFRQRSEPEDPAAGADS